MSFSLNGDIKNLNIEKIQELTTNTYNVKVGCGGVICAIIVHPTEPDLVYIRTDMGGAYRWEQDKKSWKPLNESFSIEYKNFFGIDGIAVDPNNPNIVYIACGKYDWDYPHDVLKSEDRGETWQRLNLNKINLANQTSTGTERMDGESIAVDPLNSNIIYVGTRRDGLWKNTEGGLGEWVKIPIPEGLYNKGIRNIVFEEQENKSTLENIYNSKMNLNKTQKIYVGINGVGVYYTDDAGETWSNIFTNEYKDTEIIIKRMCLSKDNILYVCMDKKIYKYKNNKWQDITPKPEFLSVLSILDKNKSITSSIIFNGLTVDPKNSNIIMCGNQNGFGIFKSTDEGENWINLDRTRQDLDKNALFEFIIPWCTMEMRFSTITCMVIDPHDNRKVWGSDGYTAWKCENIDKNTWTQLAEGIEQNVPLSLISTDKARLISGFYDVTGFRWEDDINKYPEKRFENPQSNEVTGIDFCESDCNYMVRAGSFWFGQDGVLSYSEDNGDTWREIRKNPSQEFGGRVAMSSDNINNFVCVPVNNDVLVTRHKGRNWKKAKGLPKPILSSFWDLSQVIASDRIEGDIYYIYAKEEGSVYRSNDSGFNWEKVHEFNAKQGQWDKTFIRSLNSNAGYILISLGSEGLYMSKDFGENFTKIETVDYINCFGLGKNKNNNHTDVIYIYGNINETEGNIFMSEDFGNSWLRLDDKYTIGNEPTVIEGDRQTYGRVYIGSNGRGIYCIDISKKEKHKINIDGSFDLSVEL